MDLADLSSRFKAAEVTGNRHCLVKDLAYDSREVKPGTLFFAITGFKDDGHKYIGDAVQAGAVGVVMEKSRPDLPSSIAQIKVADSRLALALAANCFYNYPSTKLKLIGVTGTNGKTTTSTLIERIFAAAGYKTGLIGTVEYRIAGQRFSAVRTTPESLDLQKMLSTMVEAGVEVAVMEVSSHAAQLRRVDGCRFAAVVFTNLTQDHLDFHQNMAEYFQAKSRLFTDPQFADAFQIINIDDQFGQKLYRPSFPCLTYGFSPQAGVKGSNLKSLEDGLSLRISTSSRALDITTRIKGIFNGANILAAVTTALEFDISDGIIKQTLAKASNIKGRFEPVDLGQKFQVIVDYAHTPDGLRQVLGAAREATKGKIITVFGCGGDRDKKKRPLMGKAALELSDLAIVTSDNPRGEVPEKIIGDILTGMKGKEKAYRVVVDRYQAISEAIGLARPGDLVLIAGKGHETGQIFSDRIVPFDDQLVAKAVLEEIVCDTSKST